MRNVHVKLTKECHLNGNQLLKFPNMFYGLPDFIDYWLETF